MRVLGIDPGSIKIGYAILEKNNENLQYVLSGILNLEKKKNFYERLHLLHCFFKNLIEEYRPKYFVLESLIYVKNPKSLIKISQARGAIISAIPHIFSEHIYEFSPNTVKSLSTGYGFSSKEIVSKSMNALFNQEIIMSYDETDAIAIALCFFLFEGGSVYDSLDAR